MKNKVDRINPEIFDEPPLQFNQSDDYGWTAIARSIVQMDGDIQKYVRQMRKKKTAEENFKNLPFMLTTKRKRLQKGKEKIHNFGRKNMIKFADQNTIKFEVARRKTSSFKSVPRNIPKNKEKPQSIIKNSGDLCKSTIPITKPLDQYCTSLILDFLTPNKIIQMIKERMKEVMKRKKDQKSSPERAKEELIKTLKKSYTKTKYQKLETFLNSPEKADYDHKISLLRVSEEDPLSLSSKNHANTLSDTKRKRVKMKSYSIMNGERAHYNESLLLRKRSLQRKKQHSRLSQMRSNVIAVSYHGSELFPLPDQRSGRGNGTSGSKRHTSEDNFIRRNSMYGCRIYRNRLYLQR
ncbi:unnamed protein product [Moneuplotes crassus]|uniref:Uncharacterized protein n=1 Tax=Euplotes crassus TaxID=5936 RepID=A0AAD1XC16_EUPCR|nr:unnamed protein product [Moneuplotes crassus]